MRECKREFTKRGKQERIPSKNFDDKPVTRYIHKCKAAKIGFIVTPETEANRLKLITVIDSTCKKHCEKNW